MSLITDDADYPAPYERFSGVFPEDHDEPPMCKCGAEAETHDDETGVYSCNECAADKVADELDHADLERARDEVL